MTTPTQYLLSDEGWIPSGRVVSEHRVLWMMDEISSEREEAWARRLATQTDAQAQAQAQVDAIVAAHDSDLASERISQ